jgi:transcriptional regulator with PAS, ATPase and Fis domain
MVEDEIRRAHWKLHKIDEDLDLRRSVEVLEKQKVLHAMKLFSGNQMRMSKALGISRGSLQYKMKQMGLL